MATFIACCSLHQKLKSCRALTDPLLGSLVLHSQLLASLLDMLCSLLLCLGRYSGMQNPACKPTSFTNLLQQKSMNVGFCI